MVLLLMAPVVSDWVPFYYSSAMTLGVFLVIIVLLYQVRSQESPLTRNRTFSCVSYYKSWRERLLRYLFLDETDTML